MDELPYALSEEDFVRMASAVRRVEGLPPRRDSQAFNRAAVEENPHAWIKITSATGSTVTLGGGTITGYAAVWGYFDSSGTGFVWTTNTAWFVPTPDGVAPVVNQVLECRLLGADTSGVPIWGADFTPNQSGSVTAHLSTDVTGPTSAGGATTVLTITLPSIGFFLMFGQVSAKVVGASGNSLVAQVQAGTGGPSGITSEAAIVAEGQGAGVSVFNTSTCMATVGAGGNGSIILSVGVNPTGTGILTSTQILSPTSLTNYAVGTFLVAIRVG